MLKMAIILDSNRGPQNALFLLSTGTIIATNTVFTAFLLLRVTGVPMVEKAGWKKWSGDSDYVAYMEKTSCLIPWPTASKEGCIKVTAAAKNQ